jgi:hypothetical protein
MRNNKYYNIKYVKTIRLSRKTAILRYKMDIPKCFDFVYIVIEENGSIYIETETSFSSNFVCIDKDELKIMKSMQLYKLMKYDIQKAMLMAIKSNLDEKSKKYKHEKPTLDDKLSKFIEKYIKYKK